MLGNIDNIDGYVNRKDQLAGCFTRQGYAAVWERAAMYGYERKHTMTFDEWFERFFVLMPSWLSRDEFQLIYADELHDAYIDSYDTTELFKDGDDVE